MMKRILATLILAALPLVAADTVRDKAAVLALFADGQPADSLSPQDMRDFIVTALNTTTNAQTGTTYTVLKSDRGKSVTHSNGASIAVTLPQATGADFGNGFWYLTKNLGAGAVTITPATSTIAGGATLVLATGQWAIIVSNGTHYNIYGVRITGGTAITVTDAVTGQTLALDAALIALAGGSDFVDFAGPATSTKTFTLPDSDATIEYQANKGAASGYASLNASTKVVEDPANATATPTASKIPIAEGDGDLNAGWIPLDASYAWTGSHSFSAAAGFGTDDPAEQVHVWGGDLEVTDPADLGSESIDDYDDFTDDDEWDYTGEVAVVSTDAVYTYASSGNGTITQVNAQLAVKGVGYRWYKAVHVVSSSTVDAGATMTITNAFAAAATELDTSDGTHTTYFQAASGAATADFVINITGAGSGAFTLESASVKEVQGGDVIINGLITGGGPTGIRVYADGTVALPSTVVSYNAQTTAGIGQPYILGNISTTGLSAAVTTANLVASAAAGLYRVSGYMQTTTAAAGACSSDVDIGWTYNSDAKGLEVVADHDQNDDEGHSQIPPTIVRVDGASNITYAISLDVDADCSNAVYDAYLVAERLQ